MCLCVCVYNLAHFHTVTFYSTRLENTTSARKINKPGFTWKIRRGLIPSRFSEKSRETPRKKSAENTFT